MSDAAYKQATIEQWTADPCGEIEGTGETGTRAYFESLDRMRVDYAPWMAEDLGYATAAGLDVLDVGCGQGIDLARYARAGANVTGVDLTPRHVELARGHLAALNLSGTAVQGDAERLPFDDDSFDRVSSNGVLHHTPNIEAALREIRRVLRPGGDATIIVYNKSSLHYWLNQVWLAGIWQRKLFKEGSMEAVLRHVEYSSDGEGHPLVRVYTPRQTRRLLEETGFTGVTSRVRQLKAGDAFLVSYLAHILPPLRDPRVLDRIGRVAGWYVVASGRAA
jgi:ubiquinone/menaquinone biosynthesis C-methylase UbiE